MFLYQVCRMNTARGLISSEQNFVDNSKLEICETVDIHSEVSRQIEAIKLQSVKSSRQKFHFQKSSC